MIKINLGITAIRKVTLTGLLAMLFVRFAIAQTARCKN